MLNTILTILIAAHVQNPQPLARSIMIVSASENVDPILLTQITIAESRGNPQAINFKTGDYGLLQLHLEAHPEIGIVCAMVLQCNLKEGAKIVKKLQAHDDFRPCMYNTGYTGARKHPKACLRYEERLANL